jgi:hypothetical protein
MYFLILLHDTINNLSSAVLSLSALSLVCSFITLPAILNQTIPPMLTILLSLIYSLYYAVFPSQDTSRSFSFLQKLWNNPYCKLKAFFIPDLYFGIAKSLQTLTVLRYIRASLQLTKTITTDLTACCVGILSSSIAFYATKNPRSHYSIQKNTIDFVLNAYTSCGYLYLLHFTAPLPISTLLTLFLFTATLSVLTERHKNNQPHDYKFYPNSQNPATASSLAPKSAPDSNPQHSKRQQCHDNHLSSWLPELPSAIFFLSNPLLSLKLKISYIL